MFEITANRTPKKAPLKTELLLMIVATLLSAAGCSYSGANSNMSPAQNPGTNPTVPGQASVPMQVKMGDAPADRVISFEVSAGPITLTSSSGSTVTALSGTSRIELSHLSATNELVSLLNIPQGNYSSMAITISKPEVTFISSQGAAVKIEPTFNQTVTINFDPALNVPASATVFDIDLNIANSLVFDAQGNVSKVSLNASSFTVSTSTVVGQGEQEAEDGELEDITGLVTSVAGTSFTMTVGQNGISLTFATDATTKFDDDATLGTLLNTIVNVEGITRADGSLFAEEVEDVEHEGGAELEGLITQVIGNPATQLSIVAQDGSGNGVGDTNVGSTLLVDLGKTKFKVKPGNIDTSGLGGVPSTPNFPFDATTIQAGQRVEVESEGAMSANSFNVEKVELEPQSLTGTVSGLPAATSAGPVTFTLTVASDSAFAMLSGQSSVTVFWQPETDLHDVTSVRNDDSVRVRGLLFFTGSGVNMIARRLESHK